ncbi:MAG: calcium-binding protein [Micrococcales bacterium]|nr:calcium-binding protein [Micrococcales bacterium]
MVLVIGTSVLAMLGGRIPAAARELSVLTDGDTFGSWQVVFAGYGAVNATDPMAEPTPGGSRGSESTHAALVVSADNVSKVSSRVRLNEQLRTTSPANPWEAGWLIAGYTDPEHFYYVACKTNGWELGKRDPAYPGGQRFLATGDEPCARLGQSTRVQLVHKGPRLTVKINKEVVVTFTDDERAYRSGRAGLYTEDADVTFDRIVMTSV